jgi:cell division septum initiation protein DivIVA
MTAMSTKTNSTTPAVPETKPGLGERVDSAVDSAQVKLDSAIDAAQDKAKTAREDASAKAADTRDQAKEKAVEVLDATQAQVDGAIGKAKDALQK